MAGSDGAKMLGVDHDYLHHQGTEINSSWDHFPSYYHRQGCNHRRHYNCHRYYFYCHRRYYHRYRVEYRIFYLYYIPAVILDNALKGL